MNKHIFLLLLCLPLAGFSAPQVDDPCADFLSVLNRPTVADSVCVVKSGQIIIEGGLQYQTLYPQDGHAFTYPNAQFRFGIPGNNEITLLTPNFITQNDASAGFTAPVAGLKHQFLNQEKWGFSAEGLFTLPTGSNDFGSDGLGFALSGIVNYNLTETFSASFMLGYSTQTASASEGGDRYNSVNPDLVFAWQCLDILQLYAEFYAQTKTGPGESDGYNADAGIQYLVTEAIELDIEYGHRLGGQLAGYAQYFGAGAGFRF